MGPGWGGVGDVTQSVIASLLCCLSWLGWNCLNDGVAMRKRTGHQTISESMAMNKDEMLYKSVVSWPLWSAFCCNNCLAAIIMEIWKTSSNQNEIYLSFHLCITPLSSCLFIYQHLACLLCILAFPFPLVSTLGSVSGMTFQTCCAALQKIPILTWRCEVVNT